MAAWRDWEKAVLNDRKGLEHIVDDRNTEGQPKLTNRNNVSDRCESLNACRQISAHVQ